jgi:nucleoside-diphosphate-sugar epimerase
MTWPNLPETDSRELQPMRHRHLDVRDRYHSVATVHALLERGSPQDVIALLAALRAAPRSALAEAAPAAAAQS